MARQTRNVGASVRTRLLQVSKRTGQNFDLGLNRYAVERLLYRLTQSRHTNRFVLKGGMLLMTRFDERVGVYRNLQARMPVQHPRAIAWSPPGLVAGVVEFLPGWREGPPCARGGVLALSASAIPATCTLPDLKPLSDQGRELFPDLAHHLMWSWNYQSGPSCAPIQAPDLVCENYSRNGASTGKRYFKRVALYCGGYGTKHC